MRELKLACFELWVRAGGKFVAAGWGQVQLIFLITFRRFRTVKTMAH